ncbi:hypothetical protein [Glycomyces paridis]|uniref:hypothetical protein n=1 Tax=Glycomyces paridis TaxID=2126555 RepID=UPI001863C4F6|nr:hypothetical protein [Glycomyces paridis]
MCQPATCRECGKTTWTGCGQHADEVMSAIPESQRCEGHEQRPSRIGRLLRRTR